MAGFAIERIADALERIAKAYDISRCDSCMSRCAGCERIVGQAPPLPEIWKKAIRKRCGDVAEHEIDAAYKEVCDESGFIEDRHGRMLRKDYIERNPHLKKDSE